MICSGIICYYSNCKYLKDGQEKWPCLHAVTVVYAWNIVEKMIDVYPPVIMLTGTSRLNAI